MLPLLVRDGVWHKMEDTEENVPFWASLSKDKSTVYKMPKGGGSIVRLKASKLLEWRNLGPLSPIDSKKACEHFSSWSLGVLK